MVFDLRLPFIYLVYFLRHHGIRAIDLLLKYFEKPLDTEVSPIFIVGCGHSGTTLMAALLNAHPDTFVLSRETFAFRFRNGPLKIHRVIIENRGDKRIVEKTPRHIRYMPRIFRLYPNARIIVMIRDGRDVACSIRQRTGHLLRGAMRWKWDNNCLNNFKNDERVVFVHMETLLEQPEPIMFSVCEFSGLKPKDDLLQRHRNIKFDYMGIEQGNARESASQHALGRARQVNRELEPAQARWLSELTKKEARTLLFLIGDELNEMSYASGHSWVDEMWRSD